MPEKFLRALTAPQRSRNGFATNPDFGAHPHGIAGNPDDGRFPCDCVHLTPPVGDLPVVARDGR